MWNPLQFFLALIVDTGDDEKRSIGHVSLVILHYFNKTKQKKNNNNEKIYYDPATIVRLTHFLR